MLRGRIGKGTCAPSFWKQKSSKSSLPNGVNLGEVGIFLCLTNAVYSNKHNSMSLSSKKLHSREKNFNYVISP